METAKEKVLKVFPPAECRLNPMCGLYQVTIELSNFRDTEELAWQDALSKIEEASK